MALTVAKVQRAAQAAAAQHHRDERQEERQRPITGGAADFADFARRVAYQLMAEIVWRGLGGWAHVPPQEWGNEGSKHATSN